MPRRLWYGLVILAIGCASASGGLESATGEGTARQSSRCDPIVSDTLLGGVPVYPACGVDTKIRLSSAPLRPQYTPRPGLTCVSASLSVIVDAQGRPVPKTERLIRTNDPALYSAMQAELPSLRYEPAKKDGQPVAQIHEMVWMAGIGRPGGPKPRC
jgi:hypothetical protein